MCLGHRPELGSKRTGYSLHRRRCDGEAAAYVDGLYKRTPLNRAAAISPTPPTLQYAAAGLNTLSSFAGRLVVRTALKKQL